ncbi:segregation and condensation protein B [Iodidimonas muriae]|uniref:Segregation and condensation protein B n=1 Tax=Iodidimonas muriae TaxID=261467 RepID=A0ABQ2L5J8_9PROT|nr:SMC-Scp complex subunit ScpB [Iodidimonas muriae]GER06322.1 segregation and condensation protein B [Kordiimonadales bacterium JCM 17843]GGO04309.1 segregation and condensation protein B [Iodidimonas muriae]
MMSGEEANATDGPEDVHVNHVRMVEAILFAADHPMTLSDIAALIPEEVDAAKAVALLEQSYKHRGIVLASVGGGYQFRTATDLSFLLRREKDDPRKLSRAAVETLAIIAYHQPVTRGEIEDIRGVGLSRGTLDVLMEAGWVKPRGRKRSPGRPLMFGTTDSFLAHFGLESLDALPGLADLKAAGLLDTVDEALDKMESETVRAQEDNEDEAQIDLEEAIALSLERDVADSGMEPTLPFDEEQS